jgi:hypothetical protein
MAFAVYDGFKTIDQESTEESMRGVGDFALAKLDDIDMDKIDSIAERLDTYDTVDPEFREAVKQFADIDKSSVNTVIDAAEFAKDDLPGNVGSAQARLHAELVHRKLLTHPVIKRLDQLEEAWASPGENGAGSRFQEVAEYYGN